MGSVGTMRETTPATPVLELEDEFNGQLGPRSSVGFEERFASLENNPINPNFSSKGKWMENCAICTAAFALYMRGYDIMAGAQDMPNNWLDSNTIFNLANSDYVKMDPDDYIVPSVPSGYGGVDAEDIRRGWKMQGREGEVPVMPRGSQKAAQAIIDKVKGWGPGSVGELEIMWSGGTSAHSVAVVNLGGNVTIYDAQSGKTVSEKYIQHFMQGTRAYRSTLTRLDNKPVRSGTMNLMGKMVDMSLNKDKLAWMFKRREKKQ